MPAAGFRNRIGAIEASISLVRSFVLYQVFSGEDVCDQRVALVLDQCCQLAESVCTCRQYGQKYQNQIIQNLIP